MKRGEGGRREGREGGEVREGGEGGEIREGGKRERRDEGGEVREGRLEDRERGMKRESIKGRKGRMIHDLHCNNVYHSALR